MLLMRRPYLLLDSVVRFLKLYKVFTTPSLEREGSLEMLVCPRRG